MKRKKITTMILSFVMMFSLASCEESQRAMRDENGIWQCRYLLDSKTECMVGDWTSKYKETHKYLDYVFFPSHINNVKVVIIGLGLWGSIGNYHGDGKYFLPYTIKKVIEPTQADSYMISGDNCISIIFSAQRCYVPSEYYQLYCKRFSRDYYRVNKANVVYNINYLNEEYKYHCVDNYAYSTEEKASYITIIPPAPERNGYEFGGWYKESECITLWDFAVDTLPLVQYDEDKEEIFQETMLYAKWIAE